MALKTDILKRLRGKRPQKEMAKIFNIATTTYASYEQGYREPDFDMINKIAEFHKVSVDYLLGREIERNIYPIDLDKDVIKIPVYGKIPAGVPVDMFEDLIEHVEIPKSWLKSGYEFFGLKVDGDSMLPKFENGDTIILKKVSSCNSGDYCAVSINCTECTFKRVIKNTAGITLQPLNSAYEPKFFSNKDIEELPITILGVVVEVRRYF